MGRIPKWRRVTFIPEVTYFKPVGSPLKIPEEVNLSIEEAEAIRLSNLERLEQEECAHRMSISRPTFHRVLVSARSKLADALLNGHEWDVPFETLIAAPPQFCPTCNTPNILPLQPYALGWGRKGWGERRRGRHSS